MRTPLVIGNWKMNGSLASATALASGVRAAAAQFAGVETAVCPPFLHLAAVHAAVADGPIALGVQNVCDFAPGALRHGAYHGGAVNMVLRCAVAEIEPHHVHAGPDHFFQ
jgi:triosephosphate isomerase